MCSHELSMLKQTAELSQHKKTDLFVNCINEEVTVSMGQQEAKTQQQHILDTNALCLPP